MHQGTKADCSPRCFQYLCLRIVRAGHLITVRAEDYSLQSNVPTSVEENASCIEAHE